MNLKLTLSAGILAALPLAASANCAFENNVEVGLISNAFEAWKTVGQAMAECGNVELEHSNDFIAKQGVAFEQEPSLYQMGGVANSSIQPLLANNLLRPLDDLVEKYGPQLTDSQLFRVDGQIMAIAMMANTQHIMYREDIFADLGLEVPTTFDEMYTVAEAIQQAGVMEHPVGGTYIGDWNLGEEFVNLYLGNGGEFFYEDGTASINNATGVATIEAMKKLTEYMHPEYLLSDQTTVVQQFQQGEIAIASLWADSAGAVNSETDSKFPGKIKMAPALMGSVRPAATLWWDGIVFAKNQTEEQADAAFRVAMEGIDTEMAKANPDTAIWLIDGFEPTPNALGAMETAKAGAVSYPASPQMGLLHDRLGKGIVPYFTGAKSADEVLEAVELEYLTSAKEGGLLD